MSGILPLVAWLSARLWLVWCVGVSVLVILVVLDPDTAAVVVSGALWPWSGR